MVNLLQGTVIGGGGRFFWFKFEFEPKERLVWFKFEFEPKCYETIMFGRVT